MDIRIRRNCAVVSAQGMRKKPWVVAVETRNDIEFMQLDGKDQGLQRWFGISAGVSRRRVCCLLKLLAAQLRTAEEKCVMDTIDSNDPMGGQGMLAASSGAQLRKSYRTAFAELPDAVDISWPAWKFTDELGQPQERAAYTLKVKTRKEWASNDQRLQIEFNEANLNFLYEAAQSDDVWQQPDDGEEEEQEEAPAGDDAPRGSHSVHDLPELPENSPCSWKVPKRQRPCLSITFQSAKKRHDTRFCTPKLVGVPELDQQAVKDAIQSLLAAKQKDEVES